MIPWIKNLLYDPASFANFIRTIIFGLGELPTLVDFNEVIAGGGKWAWGIGKFLQVSAFLVRAGDRNRPPAP